MADTPTPERWTTVQVASYLTVSYQIARNRMLAGDFGDSDYNAKTRTLTVLADRVRAAKSKRGRKTKAQHKRRR